MQWKQPIFLDLPIIHPDGHMTNFFSNLRSKAYLLTGSLSCAAFSFCHYLHLAEFACFGIRLDCCIESCPVDPIALKLSGAQDKHVRYVSCAWSHVPRWGLKSTSAGLFSFEPKFSFNVFNIDITFFFLRSVLIETKACCFICTESSNKKILSCFYR